MRRIQEGCICHLDSEDIISLGGTTIKAITHPQTYNHYHQH